MSYLSKRKYSSREEMSADYQANYCRKGETTKRPNERLWQRMHEDGPESIAERLWNNQWEMLNDGRCFIPCHGPTVRRLFEQEVTQ